jgi:hypothetical protein
MECLAFVAVFSAIFALGFAAGYAFGRFGMLDDIKRGKD